MARESSSPASRQRSQKPCSSSVSEAPSRPRSVTQAEIRSMSLSFIVPLSAIVSTRKCNFPLPHRGRGWRAIIALNKGSNVHYLLVQALAKAGLTPADIRSVFLPPADARAAFERGSVDAWAIWDPFLAAAQEATRARVLSDGSGLVSNHQFYFATRGFADAHPDLLQAVLSEIVEVDRWASTHQEEAVQLLSPRTGISVESLRITLARLGYGVMPLDDAVVAEQQRIADSFLELGLIPTRISVRDAVWHGPQCPDGSSQRRASDDQLGQMLDRGVALSRSAIFSPRAITTMRSEIG